MCWCRCLNWPPCFFKPAEFDEDQRSSSTRTWNRTKQRRCCVRLFARQQKRRRNWCCWMGSGVMANITCLTVLSGSEYIPCQLLVLTLGTVRVAKYLCCHVLTENHLPILSRFSPTMISSNFNVCTILDFCGYLLSRRCNINIVGVRGTGQERASPVISPWQLISNFHVHLEMDLSYD